MWGKSLACQTKIAEDNDPLRFDKRAALLKDV